MIGYEHITVGVNGSSTSDAALDRAARLAAVTGAELVIACAYDPRDPRTYGPLADILKREQYLLGNAVLADAILSRAFERAWMIGARDVRVSCVPGDPVDALAGSPPPRASSLLVLGRAAADRRSHTAVAALRRSRTDTLVVSAGQPG